MRALWYFQINLLWDKGTLILEPVDAGYRPKDATEAEIWAQVEKDLLYAAENLPDSWDAENLGRATRGAAKALLGKAYMQQHLYDKAKEQLSWLIEKEKTGLYGLIDNWVDNFTDLNENNKESVLKFNLMIRTKVILEIMLVWLPVFREHSFMLLVESVGEMEKPDVGWLMNI